MEWIGRRRTRQIHQKLGEKGEVRFPESNARDTPSPLEQGRESMPVVSEGVLSKKARKTSPDERNQVSTGRNREAGQKKGGSGSDNWRGRQALVPRHSVKKREEGPRIPGISN